MMPVLAPIAAALALSQALPGMTFRPAVSVSDVLGGLEMCRAVVTPTGIDPTRLQKKHWSPVKISATNGEDVSAMQNVWSPPNTIMMLSLRSEPTQASCHMAAQVRDQAVVAKVLSKLPAQIKATENPGKLEGDDAGQHIAVSATDTKDYPSINITVTRELEPK